MSKLQNINSTTSPLLLKQCETIIEGELENFRKLIRVFEIIEEMELYTEQYDDFKSYCTNRWKTVEELDFLSKETINLNNKG